MPVDTEPPSSCLPSRGHWARDGMAPPPPPGEEGAGKRRGGGGGSGGVALQEDERGWRRRAMESRGSQALTRPRHGPDGFLAGKTLRRAATHLGTAQAGAAAARWGAAASAQQCARSLRRPQIDAVLSRSPVARWSALEIAAAAARALRRGRSGGDTHRRASHATRLDLGRGPKISRGWVGWAKTAMMRSAPGSAAGSGSLLRESCFGEGARACSCIWRRHPPSPALPDMRAF